MVPNPNPLDSSVWAAGAVATGAAVAGTGAVAALGGAAAAGAVAGRSLLLRPSMYQSAASPIDEPDCCTTTGGGAYCGGALAVLVLAGGERYVLDALRLSVPEMVVFAGAGTLGVLVAV